MGSDFGGSGVYPGFRERGEVVEANLSHVAVDVAVELEGRRGCQLVAGWVLRALRVHVHARPTLRWEGPSK